MLKVVRMRVMGCPVGAADEEARRITGAQTTSGSGYFSTCYVGRGRACKVVANVNKDGYLTYLKAIAPIMGSNPHVPNVWRVIVFEGEVQVDEGTEPQSSALVEMEVLTHSARYHGDAGDEDRAGDVFTERVLRKWRNHEAYPPTYHWSELWAIIETLHEDWGMDLHSGNVMLRGTTWVLTDPLSFPR